MPNPAHPLWSSAPAPTGVSRILVCRGPVSELEYVEHRQELVLRWPDGKYLYAGVPIEVWTELLREKDSIGSAIGRLIKGRVPSYRYRRLNAWETALHNEGWTSQGGDK